MINSPIKFKIQFGNIEELKEKKKKFKWYKSIIPIFEFNDTILYKKINTDLKLEIPKLLCSDINYNKKKIKLILTDTTFIDTLNIIDYYCKSYIDYIYTKQNFFSRYFCCKSDIRQKNYILRNFRYGDKIEIHNNINHIFDNNLKTYLKGEFKFYISIKRNEIYLNMKFANPPLICNII